MKQGELPVYRFGGWPQVSLAELRALIRKHATRARPTDHARARVAELRGRERRLP